MKSLFHFRRALVDGCAVAALFLTTSAHAGLLVSDAGQLYGATDVNVKGTLYDVEFVKGTCAEVFAGCDQPLDFAFSDLTSVFAAGQALLDQVFLDVDGHLFDSHAATMAGCDWSATGRPPTNTICYIWTPFSRFPIGADERALYYHITHNTGSEHLDGDGVIGGGGGGGISVESLTNTNHASVWARWTQPTSVPEPSTLALLACGLAGLGVMHRRRTAGGRPRTTADLQT